MFDRAGLIAGEFQAPGIAIVTNQVLEPRFMDRDLAAIELLAHLRIDGDTLDFRAIDEVVVILALDRRYPVLLDPGRRVNELFRVEGIPKTFVYDRDGQLAAQSIDMRTSKQFLEMLGRAGLR